MAKNQLSHQYSVTSNLQKLTSNPGPLSSKPVLWFWISWIDLIIIPLIVVMLRFTINSFQLNITLNMFQIQTPLWSNQLLMMKCTNSWYSSTQNNMNIFWMLTSRCFRLDYWFLIIQPSIHYLLDFFINMEDQMYQSQIACYNFLWLSQPRPMWNRLM